MAIVVPRTSGPTVQTQGLPSARLTTRYDSSGQEAMGRALDKTAAVVQGIYQEAKQGADETAVFEARTQLSAWEQKWWDPQNTEGVHGHLGKNSGALPAKINADFLRQTQEIEQSLGNADQRSAFRKVAFQFSESVQNRVNGHVLSEGEKYQEAVDKASLATMSQRAATAAREGRMDAMTQEVALAGAQLDLRAQRMGLPAEAAEAMKQEFNSQTLVAAVNGMLEQGNFAGAVSFYRANADDMMEGDRSQLDNTVRNADLLVRETSETAAIVARYGTGSGAVQAAEKISDPILRDKVIANIDREAARQERASNQYDRALREQAYSALFAADPAASVQSVVSPGVLARLDPQEILAFQSFQDRRLANTQSRTDPRVFERLWTLPPDKLLKADPNAEYIAGRLSITDRDQLLRKQQDILKPENEPRSATEDQILSHALRNMGISEKDKDAGKRGAFRSQYHEAERAAVKAKGAALTQAEQEKLVNDLSLRVSRTREGWLWDSTEERRMFEIPAKERGAYTVPPDVRARILADAKADGLDSLTESEIREYYLRNADTLGRGDE